MRVAAHYRHARLGNTQLRTHGVHDALLRVTHRVQAHPKLGAVVPQRGHLGPRRLIGNLAERARGDAPRGHVVILRGQVQLGVPQRAAGEPQPIERLRAGDLVEELEVDVQKVRFARSAGAHDVVAPHLLR